MDDFKSSKVSFVKPGISYFNEDEWPEIISFLVEHLNKLEKSFKPFFIEAKATLSTIGKEVEDLTVEEEFTETT